MADDEACTIDDVTLVRPNEWVVGAFLALGLGCLAFAIVAPMIWGVHGKDGGDFFRVMFYGVVGGLFGAWYTSRSTRKARGGRHALRASKSQGVELDGRQILAHDDVRTAMVIPRTRSGTIVRVERKSPLRGPIDFGVRDVEQGRSILRALGVDPLRGAPLRITAPSLRNYRMRTRAAMLGMPLAIFGATFGALAMRSAFGAPGALAVGLPLLILVPLLMVAMLAPAKLVLGSDGVLVRWLGTKTFHPLQSIERAEVVSGDRWGSMRPIYVRLHRRGAEPIDLLAAMGRGSTFSSAYTEMARSQAAAVAERINEAIEARRAAHPEEAIASFTLARDARPIDQWVEALRAMLSKTSTFREGAALAIDELWRVLEDPDAAADHRAAAAVALSPKLDDAGRARMRVAAEATVAPKLRVALEAAADRDDARLIDALESLDRRRLSSG